MRIRCSLRPQIPALRSSPRLRRQKDQTCRRGQSPNRRASNFPDIYQKRKNDQRCDKALREVKNYSNAPWRFKKATISISRLFFTAVACPNIVGCTYSPMSKNLQERPWTVHYTGNQCYIMGTKSALPRHGHLAAGELLTNEFLLCTEPTIELLFGDHLASHAAQNLDVFFFLNLVSTNWLEQKNVKKKWYQHRPQTVQVNQLNQIALSTTVFLGFVSTVYFCTSRVYFRTSRVNFCSLKVYMCNLKVYLYFESILLYLESIPLYFESIPLYFESILLYFESTFVCFESILLYFQSILLYFESTL